MLRTLFGSIGIVAILAAGGWAADTSTKSDQKNADQKNADRQSADHQSADLKNKDHFEAIVNKVDSQNEKLTVDISSREGQPTQKTLDLNKDAEVRNLHGKTAKLSDLKAGDVIRISEKDGKVSKIVQENAATITKVDAKDGTVTVRMPDANGKETDQVFHLTEDAQYIDSDGNVAKLDVFQSGDRVLFVEEEGKIKDLSKSPQQTNVTQRPGQTTK